MTAIEIKVREPFFLVSLSDMFKSLFIFSNSNNIIKKSLFETSLRRVMALIYVCKNKYEADLSVYEEKNKHQADMIYFVTKNQYQAKGDAIWFFTDNKHRADKKIFWEKSKYRADLKAHQTNNKYQTKGGF